MEINILRVILSIILIFFLPGFFLIQALFPRRNELDEEHDMLYRLILGVVFSIIITTLSGFILGSIGINPNTDKGYFDTPFIFGSLIGISIILFIVGWYRGAYPLLGRRPPEETPLDIPKKDKIEFYKLMGQLKRAQRQLDKYNDLLKEAPKEKRKEYRTKISELTATIEGYETQMIEMGKKEMPIIKAKEIDEKPKK